MSPFTTPDSIYISRRPQDMRAGIQRLASIVVAEFGCDSMDGSLYVFVSRDCAKVKMLRFETNGWCLYYCRLLEGGFRWEHDGSDELLRVERRQLSWLLDGLDYRSRKPPNQSPRTASSNLKTAFDLRKHGIIYPCRRSST